MLNKVELLQDELNYINVDWIRDLTKEVILQIPDYFFSIPASSTGKYHPQYALGEGGLLRHTKAACKIAHDVLSLEYFNSNATDALNNDFCIAALILHDACKSGYNNQNKYTKHEHPLLASNLVKEALETAKNIAECEHDTVEVLHIETYIMYVCELIESHMGQWNENKYSKVTLPKPATLTQQLVHVFDYLASRKYIDVNV